MPPRRRERLKKHTIRLREGDPAALDAAYPTLGHNAVIRQLVIQTVDALRRDGAMPAIEIDTSEAPND